MSADTAASAAACGSHAGTALEPASDAPAPTGLQLLPVSGLPEFRPGDDLAAAIAAAAPWLADGDVLLVTSKVLSKVEGRLVPSPTDPERARCVSPQADRRRDRAAGRAGRPDEDRGEPARHRRRRRRDRRLQRARRRDRPAARRSRRIGGRGCGREFARRGLTVGVIVTDTQGRAWRLGVTDVAIGAAGVEVLADLRGDVDAHGNELVVTQVAVGDELAAAGDLVKGKLAAVPVAVARGLLDRRDGRRAGRAVADPAQRTRTCSGWAPTWPSSRAAGRRCCSAEPSGASPASRSTRPCWPGAWTSR